MPKGEMRPEHYRQKILHDIRDLVAKGYERNEIIQGIGKREGIPQATMYRYYDKAMRAETEKWRKQGETIRAELLSRMSKRAHMVTKKYYKQLSDYLEGKSSNGPSMAELRDAAAVDKELAELLIKMGVIEKPADHVIIDSGEKGFKLNVIYPEGYKGPVKKEEKGEKV